MQLDEILALFDHQERFATNLPGSQREEVAPNLVRHLIPEEKRGLLIYCKLDDTSADAVIQEQIAYYNDLGYSFEWKLYDHDTPLDLKARLLEAGLKEKEEEALMVLDFDNAPDSLFQSSDHDIRRITSPDKVEDVMGVQRIVWSEDFSFLEQRLQHDLEHNADLLSVYVAYVDGHPACSAYTYFSPNSQFASIWGGSTLPDYRKRGLYTAILGIRAREAKERGYKFLFLDASPMSKPIVARHGFLHLSNSRPMEWKPSENQSLFDLR